MGMKRMFYRMVNTVMLANPVFLLSLAGVALALVAVAVWS